MEIKTINQNRNFKNTRIMLTNDINDVCREYTESLRLLK